MPSPRTALAAATLAAALALPAAAQAHGKPDRAARGHAKQERVHRERSTSHGHTVTYLLRGTWSGGALQVTGGNAPARRAGLVGQTLALDLSGARIKVHDVDGDGSRDVDDVRDGDRVTVQLRGPRRAAGDDLRVRTLVDRGQRDAGDDGAAGDHDPAGTDDDPAGTDDDPAGTDDDA